MINKSKNKILRQATKKMYMKSYTILALLAATQIISTEAVKLVSNPNEDNAGSTRHELPKTFTQIDSSNGTTADGRMVIRYDPRCDKADKMRLEDGTSSYDFRNPNLNPCVRDAIDEELFP